MYTPSLSVVLERYFFRARPLGVALFHPSFSSPLGFGQPSHFALRAVSSSRGFSQLHREDASDTIFSATFETGHTLIAQHVYQPIDLVALSPWVGFVRLATVITLILAGRLSPPPEPPSAASLVLRPIRPSSTGPLRAEALLPIDPPAKPA